VNEIFEEEDVHSKRLECLANGMVGAMRSARASIVSAAPTPFFREIE
jgi:hypothetical protein